MVAINVAVGVVIHSYYLLESHKGLLAAGTGPSTRNAADVGPQLQVNFPKITPKHQVFSVYYTYMHFSYLSILHICSHEEDVQYF
jgi:hypothetical protein